MGLNTLLILEPFFYTSTLYEVQNSITGLILSIISIVLLTILFNLAHFSLRSKLKQIKKALEYDEQYNDSFFCWFYSLWPLLTKIYRFCLEGHLFSSLLIRLILKGFQFYRSKDTRDAFSLETERFEVAACQLSFFPFIICAVFFLLRQFGLKIGRAAKNVFCIFCLLFYAGIMGMLVYINFNLLANISHSANNDFPILFNEKQWFRVLFGCWKLAYLFDEKSCLKLNIISIALLPMCFLFYFIQKHTFGIVISGSSTVLLDDLSALKFSSCVIMLVCAFLVYFPWSLLCKISEVFEEFSYCQSKGILPTTFKGTKKKTHEMDMQNTEISDVDALHISQIRRATVDNSQKLRYFLLLTFGVTFFFSTDLLCIIQSCHFLFAIIMQSYVGLRLFWMQKRSLIVQRKTSNTLTETEVVKSFQEVSNNFYDYTMNYTIGCLCFSIISLFVAPLPFNVLGRNLHAQTIIFYCVFGFTIGILVLWPLFVVLVYLKDYKTGYAIPELAVILIASHIVGCGIIPLFIMLIEFWISWNLYNRFIYTYYEKKLED